MYPQKLIDHTTKTFTLGNKIDTIEKAYYHKDDYPINMHSHSFYEINIVVEGQGAHYIGNNVFEISAGDVFAISPKTKHGYWSTDNLNIFHLILPQYLLDKHREELNKLSGYQLLFEIEPLLRTNYHEGLYLKLKGKKFERMKYEMETIISDLNEYDGEVSLQLFENHAMIFIELLSKYIHDEYELIDIKEGQPYATFIISTIEYMNKNYAEKIPIDTLADLANMSRSTYLRRFYDIMNCTPLEYLTEIRIVKACELMKNNNLSLTNIAISVGFFDASHFSRTFKSSRGISPKQYKANVVSKY